MHFDLTAKEFRYLLDLVYIGNWILNSTRGTDRFEDYDHVESKLFGLCQGTGMQALVETLHGEDVPSEAFIQGGIHEAITYYEDAVFYEILAEELSLRDIGYQPVTPENYNELTEKMNEYLEEFEENGVDHLTIDHN